MAKIRYARSEFIKSLIEFSTRIPQNNPIVLIGSYDSLSGKPQSHLLLISQENREKIEKLLGGEIIAVDTSEEDYT